jgi:hypothetical protein
MIDDGYPVDRKRKLVIGEGGNECRAGQSSNSRDIGAPGIGVSLPLLIGIQGTADTLNLAEHLRSLARCCLAEVADSKIGFATAAVCT